MQLSRFANDSKFRTVVLFCCVLIACCSLAKADSKNPHDEFKRALSLIKNTQLEIFTDTVPPSNDKILQHLKRLTAEGATEDQLLQSMRDHLSETLAGYNDEYANYISPTSLKKYNEKRIGKYHGVGLKFRARKNNYPVVIGPIIGGPLAESDLLPGDKIIAIADQDTFALSSKEVVRLMKGPNETTISLRIERNGKQHGIQAKRGPVTLSYSRAERIHGDIGYVKISRFGGTTHEQVRKQIHALLKKNVQSFILDLRDNPGGSTRAARAIVSMFSDQQHVYCERYKNGDHRLMPRHGEHITDLPLAVLVNGNSMSSSEIVAGAFQAHKRGLVIGTPTFGKGLVQQVFTLKAPLGGAIRTTTAMFGTPDNHLIQAAGIVPDRYVQSDSDFMFRRTGSLNINDNARQYQRILLEERVRIDFPELADQLISATDDQLEAAIEHLRGTDQHSTLVGE